MKDNKNIHIKPRQKQLTKYTDEEKYALFVEGKHKVPSPQKNKKKYIRKNKYKKDNYKQECCFLSECLNTIVKYTKWHTEVNWIILSRLQSELLNKKNCENYSYSFAC